MRGRPDGLSPPPDSGVDLEPGSGHRGLGRSRSPVGDACSPAALSPVKGSDGRQRAFCRWIFPGCRHWREATG